MGLQSPFNRDEFRAYSNQEPERDPDGGENVPDEQAVFNWFGASSEVTQAAELIG